MSDITDYYRQQIADAEDLVRGRAGWDRAEYGDGQFETGFFGADALKKRWAAWHGLGTLLDDEVVTSEQALTLAGLDWDVVPVPICGIMPPAEPEGEDIDALAAEGDDLALLQASMIDDPRFRMNVRSTDHASLGIVGSTYQVVQNRDGFAFVDNLLDSAEAKFHTGMSLKGGRSVVLTARLGKDIKVGGLDDETLQMYLMFKNGHDGRHSLQVCLTPIRVVCWNTTALALKGNPRVWTLRHTSSIEGRLQEARRTLDITLGYAGELEAEANRLVETPLRGSDLTNFLNRLVPETASMRQDPDTIAARKRARKIGAIRGLIETSPNLDATRGTRWAALQGVIEYEDWARPLRSTKVQTAAENLVTRSITPELQPLKDKAYALLS